MRVAKLPMLDETIENIDRHIIVRFLINTAIQCNYIEKTQEPITGYTYNGFEEKSNYKSSNIILITYKSKQYVLHTGNRVLDKIT